MPKQNSIPFLTSLSIHKLANWFLDPNSLLCLVFTVFRQEAQKFLWWSYFIYLLWWPTNVFTVILFLWYIYVVYLTGWQLWWILFFFFFLFFFLNYFLTPLFLYRNIIFSKILKWTNNNVQKRSDNLSYWISCIHTYMCIYRGIDR